MPVMYAISDLEKNKSLGASFDGSSFQVGNFENFVVEAIITGASSLNGTLYIDGSIDGSSWYEITSQAFTANGTLRATSISSSELSNYVRTRWLRTAGTGTLNAKVGTVST